MLPLGRYSTCTTVPRCSPDAFTVTVHTCSSINLLHKRMCHLGTPSSGITYVHGPIRYGRKAVCHVCPSA